MRPSALLLALLATSALFAADAPKPDAPKGDTPAAKPAEKAVPKAKKLMGIPGMILAPVILHFVKVEVSRNKFTPQTPPAF